jgi:hypothetical protein
MCGGDQIGVVGKAEIVVCAQVYDRAPAFQYDGPGLRTGNDPFGFVKARIFQDVKFRCQMLNKISAHSALLRW